MDTRLSRGEDQGGIREDVSFTTDIRWRKLGCTLRCIVRSMGDVWMHIHGARGRIVRDTRMQACFFVGS